MKYNFDPMYIIDCFKEIVNVPSPVGYYVQMNPVIEKIAARFGYTVTYDNKSTPYITIEGEDNSKTVEIACHLDTIGMMVKRIDANGMIRVRNTGGVNWQSLEGETVTVYTRDGREYTGLMACQSHSVHVFDDARTLARDENTMMIILDEDIKCEADVRALGIRHGDMVAADDAHSQRTATSSPVSSTTRQRLPAHSHFSSISQKTISSQSTRLSLLSHIRKKSAQAALMYQAK